MRYWQTAPSSRLAFSNSDPALYGICWQKINQYSDQKKLLNRDLDQQIYHYQEFVEEILVNREKAIILVGTIDVSNPNGTNPYGRYNQAIIKSKNNY